jgi:hypothetical protein
MGVVGDGPPYVEPPPINTGAKTEWSLPAPQEVAEYGGVSGVDGECI